MKNLTKLGMSIVAVLYAMTAHADWHGGPVNALYVGYDGSIVFTVAGHARSGCTCNPSWPDVMCLNRSRISFKEEVAMLYSVRARGGVLNYNIDETTCSVIAMYESN